MLEWGNGRCSPTPHDPSQKEREQNALCNDPYHQELQETLALMEMTLKARNQETQHLIQCEECSPQHQCELSFHLHYIANGLEEVVSSKLHKTEKL